EVGVGRAGARGLVVREGAEERQVEERDGGGEADDDRERDTPKEPAAAVQHLAAAVPLAGHGNSAPGGGCAYFAARFGLSAGAPRPLNHAAPVSGAPPARGSSRPGLVSCGPPWRSPPPPRPRPFTGACP